MLVARLAPFFHQAVVVGGKEGSALDLIGQMVDHRVSNGGAVKGRSAAPQFIQNDQRAVRSVA